ncbi:MAG: DUF4339 domain-containing protein [Lachnospiraceae bacterium]|nr:DUF4339 domain-containing protein [Lachnospiraceae bacterium]MBR6156989.1 DUF4339 domain-containing protein [Lachnospiraceae bacterium]
MFCKKCGAEINEDSKFCRKCGALLQSESPDRIEQYYISDQGENKGPYTFEKLQDLFREGVLREETYVWKEDMEKWVQAKEIEFFKLIFQQGRQIKCEVCGKTYSDKEDKCPYCKKTEEKEKRICKIKRGAPIIIASLVVISVIVVGVFFYFRNFYLTKEERAEVEETIEAINSLGVIDENSGESILQAEISYARLFTKSQRYVKNIETLRSARKEYNNIKAQAVVNRIDEIGAVSKDSGVSIAEAEKEYQLLLDAQKRMVENADVLINAREEYDQLCAQAVIDEIDAIGAITLDKKTLIESAWKNYCALTEKQKLLVTNGEFIEKAEEEIRTKLADIEEAKNTVTSIMDAFNYEMNAEQIFALMGNSNVFDPGLREMLSKGFLSDMIIKRMSDDSISYADLNYLSKSALDLLENKVVEEFVHTYSMHEPQYINERIVIDVDVTSLYGGICNNMIEAMADDLKKYISNNKTTLSYMKKYYSDSEFYKSLFDMCITSYGSTWLRDMDNWRFYAESKAMDWEFTLSKDQGEWKVVSIEIEIEE